MKNQTICCGMSRINHQPTGARKDGVNTSTGQNVSLTSYGARIRAWKLFLIRRIRRELNIDNESGKRTG